MNNVDIFSWRVENDSNDFLFSEHRMVIAASAWPVGAILHVRAGSGKSACIAAWNGSINILSRALAILHHIHITLLRDILTVAHKQTEAESLNNTSVSEL